MPFSQLYFDLLQAGQVLNHALEDEKKASQSHHAPRATTAEQLRPNHADLLRAAGSYLTALTRFREETVAELLGEQLAKAHESKPRFLPRKTRENRAGARRRA